MTLALPGLIRWGPRLSRNRGSPTWQFVLLLAWASLSEGTTLARPNILVLLADDLGWTDISSGRTSLGNGSRYYETPNLDRLAEQGVCFTRAYVCQNCVPTRAAYFGGQYPIRTGIYNVSGWSRVGTNTLLVPAPAGNNTAIPHASVTLAETLKSAGYVTAHFAKFHCTDSAAAITNAHGFDYNFGGGTAGAPNTYFAQSNSGAWTFDGSFGPELDPYAGPYTHSYIDQELKPFANGANVDALLGTAKHVTDGTVDAALAFMDAQRQAGSNFFMHVAFSAVHVPIEARPDLLAKYQAKTSTDPRHTKANYAALIEGMDQGIGRILKHLEDPNADGDPSDSISTNTFVLFFSDNGGYENSTDNTPLKGAKGMFSEGGLRVPMVARWTGVTQPCIITNRTVSVVDIYPTLAALAGAPVPAPQVHPLDGESFASLVLGSHPDEARQAPIFYHFPGYLDTRSSPNSTMFKNIQGRQYKLMYFYEDRHFELFNLRDDLSEATNLLAGGPGFRQAYSVAVEMSREQGAWLDAMNAPYPTVRATGAAVPPPEPLPVWPALTITNSSSFEFGGGAHEYGGAVTGRLAAGTLDLTFVAVGLHGVLDTNANGVGVNSDADDSLGSAAQKRVSGSLSTPEAIQFWFNQDVRLRSMMVGALATTGTESMLLSFVSGFNPFLGLTGYSGKYALATNSLSYTAATDDPAPTPIYFGQDGQSPLAVQAGTVLAFTAKPAGADGGILFDALEVEQTVEHPNGPMDWGDAPESAGYKTLANSLGAYHLITNSLFLGSLVDDESDGSPDTNALGDNLAGFNDEEGVTFCTSLVTGRNAALDVVTGPAGGKLDAWIDFDGDGQWSLDEHLFGGNSRVVSPGSSSHLTCTVPPGAKLGPTYARVRLSSTGGLLPYGGAGDGELEDYRLSILQPQPSGPVTITRLETLVSNATIRIEWTAPSSTSTILQITTNLTSPSWQDLGSLQKEPTNVFLDSWTSPGCRFYRVLAPWTE